MKKFKFDSVVYLVAAIVFVLAAGSIGFTEPEEEYKEHRFMIDPAVRLRYSRRASPAEAGEDSPDKAVKGLPFYQGS